MSRYWRSRQREPEIQVQSCPPTKSALYRRIAQLEDRKRIAAERMERPPHTIRFIEAADRRVTGELRFETGKQIWTHFDKNGAVTRVEERS